MSTYQITLAVGPRIRLVRSGQIGTRGPAGIVGTGDWNPLTTYAIYDGVHHAGSYFRAKVPSTGVEPTVDPEPAHSTEWELIARVGDPGPALAGPGLPTGGAAGDLPVKASSTDFDTAWVPAGDGAFLDTTANGGPLVTTGDPRLTDDRAPDGPAGGDLTGNFPDPLIGNAKVTSAKLATGAVQPTNIASKAVRNAALDDDSVDQRALGPSSVGAPEIIDGTITDTEIAAANKDGAAGTPSMRTLGTGASQAAPGNTPALKAANLADLTDLGAARTNLGLEARLEELARAQLLIYGHSYAITSGSAGDALGATPTAYTPRKAAHWSYRLARRLGMTPGYLSTDNRAIAGQRIAQLIGVMLTGQGGAFTPLAKVTNPTIAVIQCLLNDGRVYAQGSAGDMTLAATAYAECLRTALRLLRMDTKWELSNGALGTTRVGTIGDIADANMASGGSQATISAGDVTTDYIEVAALGSSELIILGADLNTGTGGSGVMQVRNATTGAVLGEMNQADGFPHAASTTPSYYQRSLRLTGVNGAQGIRIGRKPGTAGTVYADCVIVPRPTSGATGAPLAVIVKDAKLTTWWGAGSSSFFDQLYTAVDTVVAEAEFAPYAVAAHPTIHGWDGRIYSDTTETSTTGQAGCIASDGSLVHPNPHGNLVIADAITSAILGSRWLRSLGAI